MTDDLTSTSSVSRHYPRPTAQVEPYVTVLGHDLTIEFLLTFGGAELYLADNPGNRSQLVELVGLDKAQQLAANAYLMQRRVPLAKKWLAECLAARGVSKAQIARTLRTTDISVRRWLND